MNFQRSTDFFRNQLKLAIGEEAFEALPDRPVAALGSVKRPPPPRRPRTEYRRRIAASGTLPPAVAALFTPAEAAVLVVIAEEVRRSGACALSVGLIAYRAQSCRSIVQRAFRVGVRLGLLKVDYRRVSRDRNLTNVVRIVSRVWLAWLRLGPTRPRPWGGGVTSFEGGGRTNVLGSPLQKERKRLSEQEGRQISVLDWKPSPREGRTFV